MTGKWDPLFVMVVSIPNPWTDPCKCAPAPAARLTEGEGRRWLSQVPAGLASQLHFPSELRLRAQLVWRERGSVAHVSAASGKVVLFCL